MICKNYKNDPKLCQNKSGIRYDYLEETILKKINDLIIKYFDKEMLYSYLKNDKGNDEITDIQRESEPHDSCTENIQNPRRKKLL